MLCYFVIKVYACCDFLQHKCKFVVIFATTFVFWGFHLVLTHAQFIRACQQKIVHKGLFSFFEEKNKVVICLFHCKLVSEDE